MNCMERNTGYGLAQPMGSITVRISDFFLFNFYSFSLNQTGVHIYTEAAEKCFTVEHLGAQTMSDQYFHFIKLFGGHLLQHCFAQKQRDLQMFQIVFQTEPLDHLIFEYKQII